MGQPSKEVPELFDKNSIIFRHSPGIYDLAERYSKLNLQIMELCAERTIVEEKLLEIEGASTSDIHTKLTLLSIIMRRDLRLDPAHASMKAIRGIMEALNSIHLKVDPRGVPEEKERH